ncbi:hypothetical protein GPALN_011755 [Globodera pallida]|nr:hypothetical protein GPALN_011755 [Globodera pallida]
MVSPAGLDVMTLTLTPMTPMMTPFLGGVMTYDADAVTGILLTLTPMTPMTPFLSGVMTYDADAVTGLSKKITLTRDADSGTGDAVHSPSGPKLCRGIKKSLGQSAQLQVESQSDTMPIRPFVRNRLCHLLIESIIIVPGRHVAYNAYKKYVQQYRNGNEEEPIEGLEQYSHYQLFWIASAQPWCPQAPFDKENQINMILNDVHSPDACRVNQVHQNLPDFGRDFNCPIGSPMRPLEREQCKVWT